MSEFTRLVVALERIATALEGQSGPATRPDFAAAANPAAPTAVPPQAVGAPVPHMSSASTAAPGAPQVSAPPPSTAQAPAPQQPGTAAAAPSAGPVGVPTVDDIRAAANDFGRAHPDRTHEVVMILQAVGAVSPEGTPTMAMIPNDQLVNVHQKIKALGG